jgi:hypothetical protein
LRSGLIARAVTPKASEYVAMTVLVLVSITTTASKFSDEVLT